MRKKRRLHDHGYHRHQIDTRVVITKMACFQGKSGIGIYGNYYYIKNNFIQLADRLQKKVNTSSVPFDTKLPLKGARND